MKKHYGISYWARIILFYIILAAVRAEVIGPLFAPISAPPNSGLPRPNTRVVLGGDRLEIGDRDGKRVAGTVCFYTSEGVAVCYAHAIPATMSKNLNTSIVWTPEAGVIPTAGFVANTLAGVVLTGIPLPERRVELPLGGKEDITVGATAVVYSADTGPFEATVKGFCQKGQTHVVLAPSSFSGRPRPGRSGSPIVQNGVIIAFTARGTTYGATFQAILASELFEVIKPVLLSNHGK